MEYFDTILEDKIPLKIVEIDEKEYDYICVMTDLHGTFEAFEKAYNELEKTFSREQKVLYLILGDSCDRGEDSFKLYKTYKKINEIKNRKVIHLLGNHEQMLLNSINNREYLNLWLSNGGAETIFSFDKKAKKTYFPLNENNNYEKLLNSQYDFSKKFPEYYDYILNFPHIVVSQNYIFVHAGIDFNVSLKEQDKEKLLWRRDYWQKFNNTGKKVFHGHTPVKKVCGTKNCINLDTGAVFGLKLTIVKIENGKEIYYEIKNEKADD